MSFALLMGDDSIMLLVPIKNMEILRRYKYKTFLWLTENKNIQEIDW